MSITLAEFQQALEAADKDYQLVTFSPDCVHYLFLGEFTGRQVIWDARIKALGVQAAAQYIDVGHSEGDRVPVTIGLLVSELQQPDLIKTMFMIRQYKRLQPGRHVFQGPAKK